MKKRITALLLSGCMSLTLVPGVALSAFAYTPSTKDTCGVNVLGSATTLAETLNGILYSNIKGSTAPTSVYDLGLQAVTNQDAGLNDFVDIAVSSKTNKGKLYLPGTADASQIKLAWNDYNVTLTADGTTYHSGEAPVPAAGESITYTVTGAEEGTVDIKLSTLQGSSGVQAMFLNIDESQGTIDAMNSDDTKETYCYGTVNVKGSSYDMSIKGRGNSTWDMKKKPYNLKLEKKAELIPGAGKCKKYSLLANYMDNTLLRNKVGQDLASEMGIGLDTCYVDVYMNGEYLGNYLLTEKNDNGSPDNGFMLENDNYKEDYENGGDYQFQLPGMIDMGSALETASLGTLNAYYNRMSVKDIGDDAVKAGINNAAVEALTDEAWAALEDYDSEEYQNYWDMDSWAKLYLMYEFSKSYDCFSGSVLMTYDYDEGEDARIKAGPSWDMDMTMGRVMYKFLSGVSLPNQVTAQGMYVDALGLSFSDEPFCLLQEFGKHESFLQRVGQLYNEYQDAFDNVVNDIDTTANLIEASANMDADLWGIHRYAMYDYVTDITLGTGKYALNYKMTNTWTDYVDNMRLYAEKRALWMKNHLSYGDTIYTTYADPVTVVEPTDA